VSVLGAGSGVEDEGVVDALFWGAGAGSEGCKRGRPRLKGAKLGKPADLATGAAWRRATVRRYGKTETVEVAATTR
jgi:hypothetical protein